MKKAAVLLGFTAILGGCAVPPALSIASLFADAISFVFTEKSVSDHGISFVARKDCAMWRIVTEGNPCREEDAVILVAGLADQPQTDAVVESAALRAEAVSSDAEPAALAALATAAGPSVAESPKPPVRTARVRSRSYFVIASFNKEKDAEKLALRHVGLATQVVPATVEGNKKYRVVVGPFSERGREHVRRRVVSAGFARPWMISAPG